MFCSYCGKENPNGGVFCSSCGKPLAVAPAAQPAMSYQVPQPAVAYQDPKDIIRQGEIRILQNVKNYFLQREDLFVAYREATELLMKYGEGASSLLLVFGSITFALALFFSLPALAAAGDDLAQAVPYLIALIVLGVIPGTFMILGGVVRKVNGKKKSEEVRRNYADAAWRVYEYYNQYPNCPVSCEHCDPEVIDVFLQYLESERTDAIKESIKRALKDADWGDMEDYKDDIKDALSGSEYENAPVFESSSYFEP